jgi:Chemoreceptor zinc-binding domain
MRSQPLLGDNRGRGETMDLDTAIEKHAEWKLKFRSAISKREQLDATTIAKDDRCELGRWLHGEARQLMGKSPSYSACVSKHTTFHAEAAKVAETINAGRYDDAERMLASGTPYMLASSSVAIAITNLKLEQKR